MKPYFETELGKLYHGDCLEILPQLDMQFDLVLTDIPYGDCDKGSNGIRIFNKGNANKITFDLLNLLEQFNKFCKGSFYIFCGNTQISEIISYMRNNKISSRLCIWEKSNPAPINCQHIWMSGLEPCVFGKKQNATFNGFYDNPIWRYKCGESSRHPTEKPLSLMRKLAETSSDKNDLILDPFIGSGTTAVACESLSRRWIGIEKEQKYCDIAIERLKNEVQYELFGG